MATHQVDLSDKSIVAIAEGKKDLVIEVEPSFAKIGDILIFSKNVRRSIKAIRRYTSFERMLKSENHERIFPGSTKAGALTLLQSSFKAAEEERGVIVYEIQPLLRLVQKKKK